MFNLLLIIIYLSFISLGLPDGLLGSAWPSMHPKLDVPISYAGIISMIISMGTVLSSINSDKLTRKLGTAKVTAISVALTAIALFGFSVSNSFILLCIWAIPYGLGAGSVDASINNYVALHYKSHHMSWLHCSWALGAMLGPMIMEKILTGGGTWNMGYRTVSFLQIGLTLILFLSLPIWKKRPVQPDKNGEVRQSSGLSLVEVINTKGVKEILVCFFCYCAVESTSILWASSYLNLHLGIDEKIAAGFGSNFFIGITIGRGLCGFITFILNDKQMIRLGIGIIVLGIVTLFLPGQIFALAGLVLVGLGCAPIYPCIIHSTPIFFGADRSQAIIGVEMAFAYLGTLTMPALFGVIAENVNIGLMPAFLGGLTLLMMYMHERLQKTNREKTATQA